MKHLLLMFCIARKLEELRENRYGAPVPESDEHTQGSCKICCRLQAEPSAALPAPLAVLRG